MGAHRSRVGGYPQEGPIWSERRAWRNGLLPEDKQSETVTYKAPGCLPNARLNQCGLIVGNKAEAEDFGP